VEVEALADTKALFLCIPEHVANQLELKASSQKEITTADGNRRLRAYVGPIHVTFANRECYVGAVVLETRCFSARFPWKTWIWSSSPLIAR
jgi:predicted aspartyl protease